MMYLYFITQIPVLLWIVLTLACFSILHLLMFLLSFIHFTKLFFYPFVLLASCRS